MAEADKPNLENLMMQLAAAVNNNTNVIRQLADAASGSGATSSGDTSFSEKSKKTAEGVEVSIGKLASNIAQVSEARAAKSLETWVRNVVASTQTSKVTGVLDEFRRDPRGLFGKYGLGRQTRESMASDAAAAATDEFVKHLRRGSTDLRDIGKDFKAVLHGFRAEGGADILSGVKNLTVAGLKAFGVDKLLSMATYPWITAARYSALTGTVGHLPTQKTNEWLGHLGTLGMSPKEASNLLVGYRRAGLTGDYTTEARKMQIMGLGNVESLVTPFLTLRRRFEQTTDKESLNAKNVALSYRTLTATGLKMGIGFDETTQNVNDFSNAILGSISTLNKTDLSNFSTMINGIGKMVVGGQLQVGQASGVFAAGRGLPMQQIVGMMAYLQQQGVGGLQGKSLENLYTMYMGKQGLEGERTRLGYQLSFITEALKGTSAEGRFAAERMLQESTALRGLVALPKEIREETIDYLMGRGTRVSKEAQVALRTYDEVSRSDLEVAATTLQALENPMEVTAQAASGIFRFLVGRQDQKSAQDLQVEAQLKELQANKELVSALGGRRAGFAMAQMLRGEAAALSGTTAPAQLQKQLEALVDKVMPSDGTSTSKQNHDAVIAALGKIVTAIDNLSPEARAALVRSAGANVSEQSRAIFEAEMGLHTPIVNLLQ